MTMTNTVFAQRSGAQRPRRFGERKENAEEVVSRHLPALEPQFGRVDARKLLDLLATVLAKAEIPESEGEEVWVARTDWRTDDYQDGEDLPTDHAVGPVALARNLDVDPPGVSFGGRPGDAGDSIYRFAPVRIEEAAAWAVPHLGGRTFAADVVTGQRDESVPALALVATEAAAGRLSPFFAPLEVITPAVLAQAREQRSSGGGALDSVVRAASQARALAALAFNRRDAGPGAEPDGIDYLTGFADARAAMGGYDALPRLAATTVEGPPAKPGESKM